MFNFLQLKPIRELFQAKFFIFKLFNVMLHLAN